MYLIDKIFNVIDKLIPYIAPALASIMVMKFKDKKKDRADTIEEKAEVIRFLRDLYNAIDDIELSYIKDPYAMYKEEYNLDIDYLNTYNKLSSLIFRLSPYEVFELNEVIELINEHGFDTGINNYFDVDFMAKHYGEILEKFYSKGLFKFRVKSSLKLRNKKNIRKKTFVNFNDILLQRKNMLRRKILKKIKNIYIFHNYYYLNESYKNIMDLTQRKKIISTIEKFNVFYKEEYNNAVKELYKFIDKDEINVDENDIYNNAISIEKIVVETEHYLFLYDLYSNLYI